ncbi:MAG: modification methylase SinI, partial [Candidatus Fonsibacter sp.]
MLSVKQVSENLGLSEQRVRSLLRTQAIDGKQVGTQWIVTSEALNRFKKSMRPSAVEQVEDQKRKGDSTPKCKALSFFSGAMGMDLGLEKAGIHVLLACEIDKVCRKTI